MNLPVHFNLLYQAYPPTVGRDICYGWARGISQGYLSRAYPDAGFVFSKFLFGVAIFIACILSSPFNEWRGYWLQPPSKKLPFGQFFKPERYVRSTGVGATIMGISLFVGGLLVPVAELMWAYLMANKVVGIIVLAGAILAGVKLAK